jgi:hypothetical protein
MRRKKLTPEDIIRNAVNKMFEIAGYSTCYEDIVDRKDQWYLEWTMTEEQDKAWKQWMVNYFRKECKYSSKMAEDEANMYSLMWGLKYTH